MAEWKPGMGPAEPTYEPPTLSGKGAGANAAAMAGRLESEIRAAIAMGPPPGMSKRQWERVQAAAKKQLAALDDHPDVFKDQGQKEVRASPLAIAMQSTSPRHALRAHEHQMSPKVAAPPSALSAPAVRVRSSRNGWSGSSPPR